MPDTGKLTQSFVYGTTSLGLESLAALTFSAWSRGASAPAAWSAEVTLSALFLDAASKQAAGAFSAAAQFVNPPRDLPDKHRLLAFPSGFRVRPSPAQPRRYRN